MIPTLGQDRDRSGLFGTFAAPLWGLICDGSPRAGTTALAPFAEEFPHVPILPREAAAAPAVRIEEERWLRSDADLYAWDNAVCALHEQPGWIIVNPSDGQAVQPQTLIEIMTRYQRLLPRTNSHSLARPFVRILAAHRQLHDLSKPLVRADYDHALDVWQWVLRLAPDASLSLQLAALFHDIERLVSESVEHIEQHAPDYRAYKDAHARAGASLTHRCLRHKGIPSRVLGQVEALIRAQESSTAQSAAPRSDAAAESEQASVAPLSSEAVSAEGTSRSLQEESAILREADALSFFSLNSPSFADHYGPFHTQKKVRHALSRLSTASQLRLGRIKLRADIAELLDAARREQAARGAESSDLSA
jgi:hypothetical protein